MSITISTYQDIYRLKAALLLNDIDLNNLPRSETFEAFAQDANSFNPESARDFCKALEEVTENA